MKVGEKILLVYQKALFNGRNHTLKLCNLVLVY